MTNPLWRNALPGYDIPAPVEGNVLSWTGASGFQWVPQQGPTGPTGTSGFSGVHGVTGPTGTSGFSGYSG